MEKAPTPLKQSALFRLIKSRPRLFLSIFVGSLSALFLPIELATQPITRVIIGWNAGAALYLCLAIHMMFQSSHERMRTRAQQQDEGQWIILTLVVFAALTCIGAIVAQLAVAKDMLGNWRMAHIALATITIATSWAFTQVMFALHYAHDYYQQIVLGNQGGLEFPGGHAPDYGDFLYFACVIGTSGQTADISFTSRRMRRTGLLHCILAFFFNTTLLALSINIGSSLF